MGVEQVTSWRMTSKVLAIKLGGGWGSDIFLPNAPAQKEVTRDEINFDFHSQAVDFFIRQTKHKTTRSNKG
jgi:hypothetical protein